MKKNKSISTVHYIGLRSFPKFEREKRRNPPSAIKSDYIINVLNRIGYKVNYISISDSKNNRFYHSKRIKLSEMTDFYLCPNVPGKYRESFLFRWLVHIYAPRHMKKGDILLPYHTNSMRNDLLVSLAKKYDMQFIYEVEEVYAYFKEVRDEIRGKAEIEFLQCPDKYLFCTQSLAKIVNINNKPFTTVEGPYLYKKVQNVSFGDNKIHCIYAGIIDSLHNGALSIVRACKYLPSNYVIHILGYGNITKLKEVIKEEENNRSCEVLFEGVIRGAAFDELMSKCHIGLCVQSMKEDYNEISFPSKLVTYLSLGLRVISYRAKAIESSRVSDIITFYDEDTPEAIADAIMSIDVDAPYDSKELMDSLDRGFKEDLKRLLEE